MLNKLDVSGDGALSLDELVAGLDGVKSNPSAYRQRKTAAVARGATRYGHAASINSAPVAPVVTRQPSYGYPPKSPVKIQTQQYVASREPTLREQLEPLWAKGDKNGSRQGGRPDGKLDRTELKFRYIFLVFF